MDVGIAENSKLILESVIVSSLIWSIGCMLPGTGTGEAMSSVGASRALKSHSSFGNSGSLKKQFDDFMQE